jgi:2,3-bisphosphoglycerate-dependent phosphoglycerate mutase
MEEKYGAEMVAFWSLNFETGPHDGESLKVVYERAVSDFMQKVMSAVKDGKNVIVCAHQGSLRALVKYIEDIPDEDIMDVNFSTGELVAYNFSEGRLVKENSENNWNY